MGVLVLSMLQVTAEAVRAGCIGGASAALAAVIIGGFWAHVGV